MEFATLGFHWFISLWLQVFALKYKKRKFSIKNIYSKSHSNKYKINNARTHATLSFYSQRGMGVQWIPRTGSTREPHTKAQSPKLRRIRPATVSHTQGGWVGQKFESCTQPNTAHAKPVQVAHNELGQATCRRENT